MGTTRKRPERELAQSRGQRSMGTSPTRRSENGRRLSRRNVLRGAVGGSLVTLGLPLFNRAFDDNGTALADGGAIPRRLGVFFWGNGVIPERWIPEDTGPGYTLSEELAPLAPVREWLSVVSGMDIKVPNRRGHHVGCVGILSGAPMIPQDPRGAPFASTFSAPSIDQVAAPLIQGDSLFPSLEYGVHERVITGEGTTLRYISHNGPDNPNPPEYEPRALFDRVFGESFREPGALPGQVDPRLALRRSVLDAVLEDGAALRRELGRNDQLRLDQHMDGIRGLEMRIGRLEAMEPPPAAGACAAPDAPAESEDLREKNRLMADIVAMALACDQTRVFSNLFSGSVSGTRYPGNGSGHHQLSHDEGAPWNQLHNATVYIMRCLSDMLVAFRDIPEGDGTLLDHMVVMASTDLSWDHSPRDFPVLIAGGACGALRSPGVHYRSDGENTSTILLSALRAVGADLDAVGEDDGRVTESCSAIES